MQIVIVGGGKVGFAITGQLLSEGHDITVVDNDEHVLTQIGNTQDVIGYLGNGASHTVLKEAGAADADLLLAVTETDEVNMLCCLTAHKLGAKHTIARVRNPEYFDQLYFLKEELGLSMVINPELACAQEIARLLRFPSATRVELFAKGRAELVSCRVPKGSVLAGLRLAELSKKTGIKVLICAVERGGQVIIPSGDFVPQEDDMLYFTGAPGDMERAFKKINLSSGRIRSVMIVGGGKITYYLAGELAKEGVTVKIIERDRARAEELAQMLPNAIVLRGDAGKHELLQEEGIGKVDAFVALTGLDEGNILSAAYATTQNVRKVIAKVNSEHLIALLPDAGIDSVVSAKRVTTDRIVGYVRAVNAGLESSNIESLYRIVGGRVEVLEFTAGTEGAYLNIPLKDLKTKTGVLIACLVRHGHAIVPGGGDCIQPRDGVLVATSSHRMQKLSDILE